MDVENGKFSLYEATYILDSADMYARCNSTCEKVKVGSMITDGSKIVFGCNHGVHNCIRNGCRRIELYGENSKEHRLPSDCDACHSEVDAIARAARVGMKLEGAAIFVTRYPCEACARAIAESGIKSVVYGRKQSHSEYTEQILDAAGVTIYPVHEWDREDTNV